MKHHVVTAIIASSLCLSVPAFAQNSAPGTSVQTGTASSNSANGGSMRNGSMTSGGSMNHSMAADGSTNNSMAANSSMHHSTKMKKSHTAAMNDSSQMNAASDASSGVVNNTSDAPGHKTMGNGH